jgi:Zn-dependent peptidase ImmA (M78 family)
MKSNIKTTKQIVIENLKGYYPQWSNDAVTTLANCLFRRFKDFIKKDELAVIDIVSEGYLLLNKRHPNSTDLYKYWFNQGFLSELTRTRITRFENLQHENFFDNISQEENPNIQESFKNITIYSNDIINGNSLTEKERNLFELLIEVTLADIDDDLYKVVQIAAIELNISATNLRKTFQRLREKLLNNQNYNSLELLQFATTESIQKQTTITAFVTFLDTNFIMKNNLIAYRFSEQELEKMIYLKNIFVENEFKIDRFPKVYYDDYGNYKSICGEIKNTEGEVIDYNVNENKESSNGNNQIGGISIIDLLGIYTDFRIKNDDKNTKEGIIVLFKDRIENFCKNNNISENDVRLIVLMHELGHWLTHWSEKNNENWSVGYDSKDKKTHESLAQLIAYWAIFGNKKLETVLSQNLTPSDVNNPYYLYNNLKSISKSEILYKLVEIRKDQTFHENERDEIFYLYLEYVKDISFNSFKITHKGAITGLGYGI